MITKVEKFRTDDGVLFDTRKEAILYSRPEVFICPECDGKGEISIEYNAYPDGLPDSGSIFQAGWRNEKCNICDGKGFTLKEMEPVFEKTGYKEKIG